MTQTKQEIRDIQAGINYIRLLKTMGIPEIADTLNVTEEHVKDCIAAARRHKDATEKKPEIVVEEPFVKVRWDMRTGEKQIVKKVTIQMEKGIDINFAHFEDSEFTMLMPIRIKVKRG